MVDSRPGERGARGGRGGLDGLGGLGGLGGFARFAATILLVVTVLLGVMTVWVAGSVRDGDPDDVTPVRDSLAFLRSSLEGGSAEAAQQQFPEGYFFSYVLYGLAWTDLAAAGHADGRAARDEATWALDHMGSSAGRAVFTESLQPRYGVFYAGWTLLLRAQIAALDATSRDRVAADATALAAAFAQGLDGGTPFLAAYPDQAWPVDSVVAMAALRHADRITGDDHGALIARWLARTQDLRDPATELLPHRTDAGTGRMLEGARGTSQSIIQRLWPTIDAASAPSSYQRFSEHFVRTRAGFVGIQEHPDGIEGPGDVDSGPLVLGFSASATAVAVGAARANGDADLAVTVLHEADVFGVPLTAGGERRYAFGAVPIGDAFLTWARATPTPSGAPPAPAPVRAWWPLYLVLPWSVIAVAWLAVRRAVHRERTRRPAGA